MADIKFAEAHITSKTFGELLRLAQIVTEDVEGLFFGRLCIEDADEHTDEASAPAVLGKRIAVIESFLLVGGLWSIIDKSNFGFTPKAMKVIKSVWKGGSGDQDLHLLGWGCLRRGIEGIGVQANLRFSHRERMLHVRVLQLCLERDLLYAGIGCVFVRSADLTELGTCVTDSACIMGPQSIPTELKVLSLGATTLAAKGPCLLQTPGPGGKKLAGLVKSLEKSVEEAAAAGELALTHAEHESDKLTQSFVLLQELQQSALDIDARRQRIVEQAFAAALPSVRERAAQFRKAQENASAQAAAVDVSKRQRVKRTSDFPQLSH